MSDDKASGVMVGSHPVVQSADSAANSNPPKDAFDRYAIDTEADPFKDEIEAAKAQREGKSKPKPKPAPTATTETQVRTEPRPESGGQASRPEKSGNGGS